VIAWRSLRRIHRSSRTQRETRNLYREWRHAADGSEGALVHPLWSDARQRFAELVRDGVPDDFLTDPFVRHMLHRTGFGELEEVELAYLGRWRGPGHERLKSYREPVFGSPTEDCAEFGVSASALNKLYYVARIREAIDLERVPAVLELGAGYGLLCQALLSAAEGIRVYVLIDLPELLALQYAYLRETTDIKLVPHHAPPSAWEQGAVHFVPIHVFEQSHVKADLVISTFALSETPRRVHDMFTNSAFFGASAVYIIGQNRYEEPWREHALESLRSVRATADQLYRNVRLEPFPAVNAWELTAWRDDVARTE
jgi:hypothetical protein